VFDRLYDITRAYIGHHLRKHGSDRRKDTFNDDEYGNPSSSSSCYDDTGRSGYATTDSSASPSGIPQQVIDDLAVFGLKPPGSMDEVIRARNREMKTYHPDKFMTEDEKVDAANEIAQIYNAAFERLKAYYGKVS
jgi:DnaJ-domain-containing protein 1